MKKKVKRVLVLYTSYGMGHYKAALAIKEYISQNYKDMEVTLMDPLTLGRPIINKVFANVGKIFATRLRGLRRIIYKKKMYRDYFKKSWFYDFCIKLFFTKNIKRVIMRFDPDVIISTQVGPTGIIAGNKKMFRAKLVSVLTDYGIHRMFTVAHEFVDLFWVPTMELKNEMVELGISDAKIMVTGIPVNNKFLNNRKSCKEELCKKWEIPVDKPIFLFVCGGGNGYANALKYFSMLLDLKYDFSYVFIAGKNKMLYRRASIIGDISGKFGVTLGYVDNMEDLLNISDLVLGKPGGLITSEALNMGLPFIAIEPIPGQETFNGKFILENKYGYLVNSKREFKELLDEINENEKIILEWHKNIKKSFQKFNCPDINEI